MSAKHSPTPWRIGTNKLDIYSGGYFIATASSTHLDPSKFTARTEEANMEFILIAVNAYESLVAENKRLVEENEKLKNCTKSKAEEYRYIR